MSASPQLKVFTADGEYVASCHYFTDAAALVALHGVGASVRWGHSKRNTLFTEGALVSASASYDEAADIMRAKLDELRLMWGPARRATGGAA